MPRRNRVGRRRRRRAFAMEPPPRAPTPDELAGALVGRGLSRAVLGPPRSRPTEPPKDADERKT